MRHKIKPTGHKFGHRAVSLYADGTSFSYIVVEGSDRWDSKGCNRELHMIHRVKSKWAKVKSKQVLR